MARERVSFGQAVRVANKRWSGAESDVSGVAWVFVMAHASWYWLVGIPR